MPKRKQGEVDNEGVQDFELIELLIRERETAPSTSTQRGNDFESFKARFQSYIDQIPSYLHSVGKEGFFPHFFLGSFSTLIDTEIAKKLDIEKIYFRFDGSKTLKVTVTKKGEIKSSQDAIDKVNLFVIADSGSKNKEFSHGELEEILSQMNAPGKTQYVSNAKSELEVKLVEISKNADNEMTVEIKNTKLDKNDKRLQFTEIKKGKWNKPENDIAKLTNSDKKEVEKSLDKVLKKVSKIHSEYKGSLIYADKAREAAHHGFMAGALVNFRYRYNLRVYLEQFAGRGYADIVLVPRGEKRALDAIPIIIEMKAATKEELKELEKGGKTKDGSQTTPAVALKQAEDYTKGFQPNVMRVLTTANDILCVGVNLDYPSAISDIATKSRDQEITPLFNNILESIDKQNNGEITQEQLKTQIQENIERIYHTFPGTGEKGDSHYFSRFLSGQSLLLNEVRALGSSFRKHVFIYGENIPTEAQPEPKSQRLKDQKSKGQGAGQPSHLDRSHGVVTMVFIPSNDQKSVCAMNIVETGGRDNAMNKGIPLDKLKQEIGNRKIVELNLNFNIKKKSKFEEYFSVEVGESVSLEQHNGRETNKFEGNFKDIPYPAELKETFDAVLESQLASSQDQSQSIGKYKELFGKLGEAVLPFKVLIEREAHTQAVFHGAFSHYSDIKLGESQENRALVLTEFQTGRGKRIDMVVHGIKFADQASSAKEYDPVGLELKGPREGKTADALVKEANDQINTEYVKGVTYKTLTDGKEVAFMGVVFDKGANSADSLILMSKDEFASVKVIHSSIFSFSQQQCSKGRKQRSTGMACIDSRDEEEITKEEKERFIKELFGIEAYDTKIITIDSPQVRIDGGKMSVKFKDNDGNDKELIIDDAANIKSVENYILDKENLEIKLKVNSDKEYAIIEEVKEQGSEYYLRVDDYRIKLDSIFQDGKEVIFNKLHQLSNDKQLLENKKYIEDIGGVQTNQDYNNIVEEIKQNLLAKGVREDTFDRFKSHFDDLGEKVFADYISNVESSLQEKGIAFNRDKFDSAKIKGAKGGKFFSMMAIYDLLDSIGDTATLGRHNNDALKQVFGINGILDAMDDVRTSVSISPSSKVGKLIGKIPGPARQAFVKVISNPVVQSITFATIAYQFGYSINEIAQGNNHPLNYYWTTSSGVKLASMSIRPISAGVSFTIKSVSATTKILRGLSAAGKVLGRAAVVTMVADVLITMGVKIHERMEYTKAIAEQVPLLPGGEQAEVFFAGVIKFFTGRDVEKEYEDTIRIKGYLTYVKEAAIKLLNDNYDIDAVVQYVISIEEKYSEVIKNMGAQPICIMPSPYGRGCATQMKWTCDLEKKYKDISFDKINIASSVKRDLSSIDISKILTMTPYTLVMSEGWERFICGIKNSPQCYQEIEEKKVYVVNTDAKHIPHLTKYEYENLGLRVVDAPLTNPIQKSQCSKIINTKHTGDDAFAPCNSGKIYRNCQESFTLSGEPFIFTNPKRKDPGNTKKQTFPRGSILYISWPKTLTAAANYPAVMHIPEGSNIRYIGSKNNETIFIINNSMSGTLKGGAGKENTLVMNVKANNIAANLHSGTIRYGNSNNIRLVNTYNYVSNSDNKQNITTHCETRLINVKNAEVWQNSSNCTDKDYEARVVNKENVHHRGLKQTIFIVNEDSDNARIISDLGSTGEMKGNIDVIRVQVANITQWGVSKDTEKDSYSLDLLANDTQSIASSTTIDDFKNLVIQVNCQGITESVTIQDKSLSDTIEDIRYQKLRNSGSDTDREIIQNSEKKLKAFIQASILDQELLDTYQIAKGIADDNNFDIPISQIEVIKNHMGIPSEKVIIACMYSGQVIVDFSYNNSDVTSSYQKYQDNRGSYDYAHYMILCNYYQDVTVEGREGQHQYIIKLPDTLNSEVSSSPIRINLKIKNKAAPYQSMSYNIIDFAELNVTDVDSISIQKGKRSYTNECYNQSISDLTEDSLEIKDITVLGSEGTRWSLSVGLVDYFQSPEHQQIVLQMNNKLYKIDSTNLKLEHVEMDPNSFRYYQPDEQGLQIYHNQPIDKNEVGLVDFRDKSMLGFDMEIADDSLVLSYGNSTIAKVENWSNYLPAREMMFAFNDTMVSNLKCIVSACNSEGIIVEFNQKKVILLKEEMFDAIVQNGTNEANDLIRKIETIEGKSGLIPLYVAIQAGRLDIVEILFERKHFSVKDKDIHPLHWAAQQGNLNIAKFLVDKGADIGAKDNDGRTSLRIAACNGSLDMVKFFLDKNASIEAKSNDPYKMMEIVESAKKEIINQADTAPNIKRWAEFFVEKLRYSIKNVVQKKLKDGMLHDLYDSVSGFADEIYRSDGKLFDDIIKGVINEVYGKVDTKKILSFVRNHGYIAQLISSYVAVFDAMQENDDLNTGAVFELAYYIKETMNFDNYADVRSEKRSDLEGLKSRLPESVRNIVFASEVCIKSVESRRYLYSPNDYKDFQFGSDRRYVFTWPLVGYSGQSWKIEPNGDNVYLKNVDYGRYLYSPNDYKDFQFESDSRYVFTWPSVGYSGQSWKIEPNGDNVYLKNVDYGRYLYSPDGRCMNHFQDCDPDRRYIFTSSQNLETNQFKWKIEDCSSTVRKRRSQVAGGSFNRSIIEPPVCNASVNSHFEEDVEINAQDVFGRKPIHIATVNNNKNAIELFLSKKVSIDDTDEYGLTPLYYASWYGHLDLIKYLVENGADINVRGEGGETALDAAIDKKHDDVEMYLKQVQLDERLLIAVQYGNFDEVKDFVSQGASLGAKYSDGRALMHWATYGGKLDIVKYLVDKGANINAKDKNGRVSLNYATYNGKLDIVKYFIDEKNININIKDSDGLVPLHFASSGGHLGIIEYLIGKGANINAKDKNGQTPLDFAVQKGYANIVQIIEQRLGLDKELLIAVQENNLDKVKDLINQGASINAKDEDGKTPLHYASQSIYSLDIVRYLISKGADIDVKDNSGSTPENEADGTHSSTMRQVFMQAHLDKELLLTVKNEKDLKTISDLIVKDIDDRTHGGFYYTWSGNLGTVEFLVSKDVSVNATDKYGCTLLHWSALKGHSDIAKFLVDRGANVNAKDILGRTPMHFAVMNNHKDIQDVYGRGPTYTTAESNDEEIVQLFLMKGASVNEADENGETPLHLASWDGHLGILQHLINNGANIGTKDSSGKTPLDIARDKGHNNIVQYLQQTQSSLNRELLTAVRGGDLNKVKDFIGRGASLDAKDEYGRTLLHWASWNGNLDAVKYLIGEGASIQAEDRDGKTPLDIAIDQRHDSVAVYLQQTQLDLNKQLLVAVRGNDFNKVKDLVSKGASVDTKDSDGWTLLHHTARRGYLEVAEFLIEKGADINAEDKYGKKPIQRAAEDNNKNIITLLLRKGVNINDTDKNGRTSLYWASYNGNLDAVKYLISQGASIQAGDKGGKTPLDIARDKGYNNIVNYLEEELNKEREKPAQRKRRHLPSESLDSVASSGTRSFSWINSFISWAKSLAASTFSIIPGLPTQYSIADKNNVKSDNKNIPQSTAPVDWNNFLNNENIALASCVADALDDTSSKRYQNLISKGVEVVPNSKIAVEFALRKFDSFVEGKIRNLGSKEQARIHVELKDAYPEIIASLERGVEFSGNVGLDNVLEKCKKCFCTNVLPKDKVSTCLSGVGVTKLENNLSR